MSIHSFQEQLHSKFNLNILTSTSVTQIQPLQTYQTQFPQQFRTQIQPKIDV